MTKKGSNVEEKKNKPSDDKWIWFIVLFSGTMGTIGSLVVALYG